MDSGRTALHCAIDSRSEDVVAALLSAYENGVVRRLDINATDNTGMTPLCLASRQGAVSNVKMLLRLGEAGFELDVNAGPAIWSFEEDESSPAKASSLDHHFAGGPLTQTLDHRTHGTPDIIRLLLNHPQLDPNVAFGVRGETALHVAVRKANLPAVELLLNDERCDVDRASKSGTTPLHLACPKDSKTHTRILETLLRRRPTVDARDEQGRTALHIAVQSNNVRAAQVLLSMDCIQWQRCTTAKLRLIAAVSGNENYTVCASQLVGWWSSRTS